MHTIDVFGMMPVRLGQAEPPFYRSQNDIPKANGVFIYRDRHGKQFVLSRQGSWNASGNFSGCEQGVRYEDWVKGGRLNLCTGRSWNAAVPAPTKPVTSLPPTPSSGVHPAVIAGGVGAAGFVALVATGVIKL